MKRCAFLSLDDPGDFVIDDEHAIGPLADIGWMVSVVSWRQSAEPWRDFDAVIIRSTWDYWHDVAAFTETLSDIDRQARLANPIELVHWNLQKTYLCDLERRGVRIVPTIWLDEFEPGALGGHAGRLSNDHLVIKPQVGANGDDVFRLSPADDRGSLGDVAGRFSQRACMLQPFRRSVLVEGEFSLFFFDGTFSHAILKTPAAGEFRSQEERGSSIRRVEPESLLVRRGREALSAVTPRPLYARADLVRDDEGDFELMELELIEPSLYLRMDPDAPVRFARAVDDWFERRTG